MAQINVQDVKTRLRDAHASDIRHALLVGRCSDSVFHDALVVIELLEKRMSDTVAVTDKLIEILQQLKLVVAAGVL